MSDSATRDLFKTANRSRSLRLRERTVPGTQWVSILLEERREEGWTRVGTLDLSANRAHARGRCKQDIIAEWSYYRWSSVGDRVRRSRRLRKQFQASSRRIVLEQRRAEKVGFGDSQQREWRVVDGWSIPQADGGAQQ